MVMQFRQKIEDGFGCFAHLIYYNHWKVLFLVFLLVAGFASQLPKLTMDTSTEGFLHPDDPAMTAYDDFRNQFGRDGVLAIAITAPDIFDLGFLTKLKQLHEELRSGVPYLDDITSLINARNTRGEAATLIVEDLLEEWPEDADALAVIKKRALNNQLYRGLLLSEDSTTTVIVIKTDVYSSVGIDADAMDGFDDDAFESGVEIEKTERPFITDEENSELVIAAHKIADRYDGPDFKVRIGGGPEVMYTLKQTMQTNMQRFVRLALATIAVALLIMFRRISGVVLPLLVVILSLVSTLSVMAMAGIAFKLPTQILPSFLMAVGVGASVHVLAIFFSRLQQGDEKEESIVYAMRHSGLAIVMTSLTTAAGLASFAGAEVAPISDLGILASSGVLLSLFFTIVLLPAL
ncbi:RND family transporter, partial [Pseudomonadota bacterium]